MSLDGLSGNFKANDDHDVVEKLKENEKQQELDKEAKEILKLMTANREKSQYKTALAATIKEIKEGKPVQATRKDVTHGGEQV